MAYARDKNAIAICDRSGQKMLRADMIEDGYLRGMMVHPEWYDGPQQQEEPFDPEEGIAIYKPAPDLVAPYPPYSAVLTGGVSGSNFVLNWTQQDVPWGTLNNCTVWRQLPGGAYLRVATVTPVIPVDFFIQTTDQIKGDPLSVVTGLTYTDVSFTPGSNYYVIGNFVGALISEDSGFVASAPSNIVSAPNSTIQKIQPGDNSTGPFGGSTGGQGYYDGTLNGGFSCGTITPHPSQIAGGQVLVISFIQHDGGSGNNQMCMTLAGVLAQNAFTSWAFTDTNSVVETYLTSAAVFSSASGNSIWLWPAITNFPFAGLGVNITVT